MSGSGKSSMVIKILKEQFYQTPATDIIICVPKDSSEDDSSIKDYKSVDPEKIIIHNGLPDIKALGLTDNPYDHKIVVYIRLMDYILMFRSFQHFL